MSTLTRTLGAASVAIVVLLGGGCAAERARPATAPAPAAPAADGGSSGIESGEGTYFVSFTTRPDPIPVNAEFEIEAVVLDAKTRTRPAEDVDLAVDAGMPEHGHGMNVVPRVERLAGGRFRAVGLVFHMPGRWELAFDVTRGAVTERAQTLVEID